MDGTGWDRMGGWMDGIGRPGLDWSGLVWIGLDGIMDG